MHTWNGCILVFFLLLWVFAGLITHFMKERDAFNCFTWMHCFFLTFWLIHQLLTIDCCHFRVIYLVYKQTVTVHNAEFSFSCTLHSYCLMHVWNSYSCLSSLLLYFTLLNRFRRTTTNVLHWQWRHNSLLQQMHKTSAHTLSEKNIWTIDGCNGTTEK